MTKRSRLNDRPAGTHSLPYRVSVQVSYNLHTVLDIVLGRFYLVELLQERNYKVQISPQFLFNRNSLRMRPMTTPWPFGTNLALSLTVCVAKLKGDLWCRISHYQVIRSLCVRQRPIYYSMSSTHINQ